jgi:glyoxylase-like metal-dependent hydrolase (beta-lactamase superfamily II)
MPDHGTARADFPGGDAGLLYRSIRRILELPADTRLFTSHDYKAAGRDRTLLLGCLQQILLPASAGECGEDAGGDGGAFGEEDPGGASEYWHLHRRRLPFTDASRRV